jgi:hypothetical protein
MLEGASKALLENEFGTTKEDEAVRKILEKGSLQEFEVWLVPSFFFSPSRTPSFLVPRTTWRDIVTPAAPS